MGIKHFVATVLAVSAVPALAAGSIIITPRLSPADALAVPACASAIGGNTDSLCTASGNRLGLDFGSTAQLSVRHSQAISAPNSHGVFFQSQFGATYLPGFLQLGTASAGVILFTPAAGFEVRLLGFDARRGTATFNQGVFNLFDAADQNIWTATSGPGTLAAEAFTSFSVNSGWSTGPLRFTYDELASGATVVSNIALDVRQFPVTPGVPEPASWAMLIAGFGLTGMVSRRRRTSVAA